MWNPLSWVMEAAAIMAIALANGKVRGKVCIVPCSLSLSLFYALCLFILTKLARAVVGDVIIIFYFVITVCPSGLARFCWNHGLVGD